MVKLWTFEEMKLPFNKWYEDEGENFKVGAYA